LHRIRSRRTRHASPCLPVLTLLCALVAPAFAAGSQVGQVAPTLLIYPHGRSAKVYVDVDPQQNSAQVMADRAALKAAP